jgi:HAE1 family hydrophobic/amphiphilic exporter-1
MGRVASIAEMGDLVVATRGGLGVRVRDVGRVEDGEAEASSAAMVNGASVVMLSVRKQSGTNTLAVIDALQERIAEMRPDLPPGFRLEVVRDESEFIRNAVGAVEEHLFIGGLLAALVVLLFLWNGRSTLIAALAIPTSIIATFGLIKAMGLTLNVITLLALTLAVGIVIDDAIVVLENIFRFIDEKGVSPRRAAVLATKEIGLAVLATTLSLVAVFLPVAFMGGIVGRFMASFGFTMSFAIGCRCWCPSRSRRCSPRGGSSPAPRPPGAHAPGGRRGARARRTPTPSSPTPRRSPAPRRRPLPPVVARAPACCPAASPAATRPPASTARSRASTSARSPSR